MGVRHQQNFWAFEGIRKTSCNLFAREVFQVFAWCLLYLQNHVVPMLNLFVFFHLPPSYRKSLFT